MRNIFSPLLWALALFASLAGTLHASLVCVKDDTEREICLAAPAQRIIALSPGATELLYAAGAAEQLIAAVSHSDYPEAAKALPRVGSYNRFDLESILSLQPDLLIGWHSGNPTEQLAQLEALGLTVYYSELRGFDDVSRTLRRLGTLAGTEARANAAADDFQQGIEALRRQYQHAKPVPVFQQIWVNPLMTVNDEHLISEATRLCGGVNVFGALPRLAARIDHEAVLAANPEAIIAGGMGEDNRSWLNDWRSFSGLLAVQRDNLFFIPPSTLQRPTPRLLDGTRLLCQHLDTARGRR